MDHEVFRIKLNSFSPLYFAARALVKFSGIFLILFIPKNLVAGRIIFEPGVKTMVGGLSTPNQSIASRTFFVAGAEVILGFEPFKPIILGVRGDYSFAEQITAPSSINNSNLRGNSWSTGGVFGLQLSNIQFLGFYNPLAKFTPTFPTTGGDIIYFDQPRSYGASIRYISNRTFFGVEYQQTRYRNIGIQSSSNPNPQESTLLDGDQVQTWAAGLSIGAFFK